MARQCYVIMINNTYQLINISLFPALSSYCESCCTGHSYTKKWKFCLICFGDRVLLFQSRGLSCLGLLHGWSAGAHRPTQYSRTSFPKDIRFIIILGVGSLDYTETLTFTELLNRPPDGCPLSISPSNEESCSDSMLAGVCHCLTVSF